MRISPLALVVILSAAPSAHADREPLFKKALATAIKTEDSHTLSRPEIDNQIKPISAALEHCYLDHTTSVRGAGHLDIKLTVHRNGRVSAVEVATPKLAVGLAAVVDRCVRAAVTDLRFPTKKAFTTIVMPYFFQRTLAPDSGPQLSCWDPNGCH